MRAKRAANAGVKIMPMPKSPYRVSWRLSKRPACEKRERITSAAKARAEKPKIDFMVFFSRFNGEDSLAFFLGISFLIFYLTSTKIAIGYIYYQLGRYSLMFAAFKVNLVDFPKTFILATFLHIALIVRSKVLIPASKPRGLTI